jgi:hypothetical protein
MFIVSPCSSALQTFASRFFCLRIQSPRSTKNACSISTPVLPKSGFATSTERSRFSLVLIIRILPLLLARCSLTGFPESGILFLQSCLGFRVTIFHCRFAAEFHAAFVVDSDTFHPNHVPDFHDIFDALDAEIRELGNVHESILTG